MLRVVPEARFAVELVIVRWSAAPAITVKVVVSSVRPVACACSVIEPASTAVTVSVATPLTVVAEVRPVTVPVPAVFVKSTEVELSVVRRLPAASRTSAVMSRVAPEARLPVALVIVRWSAAPATTVKVVVSSVSEPEWAVSVIEPARTPVTVSVATPLTAAVVVRPVTVPVPADLVKSTDVELSAVSRLPAASRT